MPQDTPVEEEYGEEYAEGEEEYDGEEEYGEENGKVHEGEEEGQADEAQEEYNEEYGEEEYDEEGLDGEEEEEAGGEAEVGPGASESSSVANPASPRPQIPSIRPMTPQIAMFPPTADELKELEVPKPLRKSRDGIAAYGPLREMFPPVFDERGAGVANPQPFRFPIGPFTTGVNPMAATAPGSVPILFRTPSPAKFPPPAPNSAPMPSLLLKSLPTPPVLPDAYVFGPPQGINPYALGENRSFISSSQAELKNKKKQAEKRAARVKGLVRLTKKVARTIHQNGKRSAIQTWFRYVAKKLKLSNFVPDLCLWDIDQLHGCNTAREENS